MPTSSTPPKGVVTWEDTESYMGKEFPTFVGVDAIERGWIRRWDEVIESDFPLHYDQALAKRMGFKDIVAPDTFVFAACVPAYWKPGDHLSQPGDPHLSLPGPTANLPMPPSASVGFVTNVEEDFIAPMYPGDRISQTSKMVKLMRKKLRVGDGAFITTETTYRNQNDVVVGVQHMTLFIFEPAQEGS